MSSFNKFEKKLAKFLSANQGLKNKIKYTYKVFFQTILKPKKKYVTPNSINTIDSKSSAETFFGYYDKSPSNENNDLVIYQESNALTSKDVNHAKEVSIILYDKVNNKKIHAFKSKAFNWQQGTKLQWLSNDSFIFNDYDEDNDHYFSRLISTLDFSEKEVPHPVYETYKDKIYSIDFRRLSLLNNDYGYFQHKEEINLDSLNDGILEYNLETSESKQLVSLKEITEFNKSDKFSKARHCINHLMISPDGSDLMFIHRYYISDRRFDRLLLVNVNTGELQELVDEDMVSHCCWKSNDTIIGFFRYNGKDAFHELSFKNNEIKVNVLEELNNYSDGHPTFLNDKLLFDCYPNRTGMQSVFVFDYQKKRVDCIGKFYSPVKFFGVNRCDLHPRFSSNGNSIFIDSVHTGKRELYEIAI
jgi:hypothetical protein